METQEPLAQNISRWELLRQIREAQKRGVGNVRLNGRLFPPFLAFGFIEKLPGETRFAHVGDEYWADPDPFKQGGSRPDSPPMTQRVVERILVSQHTAAPRKREGRPWWSRLSGLVSNRPSRR